MTSSPSHPTGRHALRPLFALAALGSAAALIAGCATEPAEPPPGKPRIELVWAVTEAGELIHFNAGQPQKLIERRPLTGLPAGEHLVGIDYRVKTGVLHGLASGGRLYTIDTKTGAAKVIGNAAPAALTGSRFGVDFNPVADRVRVVSETSFNMRFHPETGAVVAYDPPLRYGAGDVRFGSLPAVTAAAYSYNKVNDKITTNYALDIAAGTLVMQGSKEGAEPVVSPNTGLLRTVGSLGVANIEEASFDISAETDEALATLRTRGRTRLYTVDLATGRATLLGTVGDGRALRGFAILP
jgi:hypothetical protein